MCGLQSTISISMGPIVGVYFVSNSTTDTTSPGVSKRMNALHEYVDMDPSFSISSVVVLEVST